MFECVILLKCNCSIFLLVYVDALQAAALVAPNIGETITKVTEPDPVCNVYVNFRTIKFCILGHLYLLIKDRYIYIL